MFTSVLHPPLSRLSKEISTTKDDSEIWGFHGDEVSRSGVLGCDAV